MDPGRSNGMPSSSTLSPLIRHLPTALSEKLSLFLFVHTLPGASEAAALAASVAFPGGMHVGGGVNDENALQCIPISSARERMGWREAERGGENFIVYFILFWCRVVSCGVVWCGVVWR